MKKLGPYLRKLLYLIGVILLILLLVVLNKKLATEEVSGVSIRIDVQDDLKLITEERVEELLGLWYSGGLVGRRLDEVNINDIEDKLVLEASIKSAQVSRQLNGQVVIEIEQRIPILRVIRTDGFSFYMDPDGFQIPVGGVSAARVPVATEIEGDTMIKKVYTVSTSVQENDFMKALVEQIFVNKQGDLVIIPKIHHQQIILGDTNDLEDKFKKLEVFYRDGLKGIGWDKYKTINLKYKDQVVCN